MLKRRYGGRMSLIALVFVLLLIIIILLIKTDQGAKGQIKCVQVNLSYKDLIHYQNEDLLEEEILGRANIKNTAFKNDFWKKSTNIQLDIGFDGLKDKTTQLKDGQIIKLYIGCTIWPEGRHFFVPVTVFKSSESKVYSIEGSALKVETKVKTTAETQQQIEENYYGIYKRGYVFGGWYYYENDEEKYFDITTKINKNYHLHAKWYEEDSKIGVTQSVINNTTEKVDKELYKSKGQITISNETVMIDGYSPSLDGSQMILRYTTSGYVSLSIVLIALLLIWIVRDLQVILYARKRISEVKEQYFQNMRGE